MGVGGRREQKKLHWGWGWGWGWGGGGGGVRDIMTIYIYIRSYKAISYIIFIIQKPIQM